MSKNSYRAQNNLTSNKKDFSPVTSQRKKNTIIQIYPPDNSQSLNRQAEKVININLERIDPPIVNKLFRDVDEIMRQRDEEVSSQLLYGDKLED